MFRSIGKASQNLFFNRNLSTKRIFSNLKIQKVLIPENKYFSTNFPYKEKDKKRNIYDNIKGKIDTNKKINEKKNHENQKDDIFCYIMIEENDFYGNYNMVSHGIEYLKNFQNLCSHSYNCCYIYISPSNFNDEQVYEIDNKIKKIFIEDYNIFELNDGKYLNIHDNCTNIIINKLIEKVKFNEKIIEDNKEHKLLNNVLFFIIILLGLIVIYHGIIFILAICASIIFFIFS
jgi:hypothetical protein